MKRILTIWVLLLGFSLVAFSQETRKQQKVAVVLSGGGAKGMAHIGVLKVLERAGIPIDIITGTSMGSIVGGMYACGNDAALLDSIVRAQDWTQVFADKDSLSHLSLRERERQNTYVFSTTLKIGHKHISPDGGIIVGKNIGRLFDLLTYPYNDSISFDSLPIRFACVATNIVDNTEYVFHSGVLSRAMRASMAIPGAFSPVRMNKMVLVDGGLRNNYPADVAKDMGATFIIGSSVQDSLRTEEDLKSTKDILLQIVDFNCKNKVEENLAITNIPIMVDVKGYSSASFSAAAIDTLIRRGEEAAMAHWDELVALAKQLNRRNKFAKRQHVNFYDRLKPVKIGELRFVNMTASDEHFIRTKFRLHEGDSIDGQRANLITSSIRMDLFYKSAQFRFVPDIVQQPDGTKASRVEFYAGEKKNNLMSLGIRFDNEELVALQTNVALPIKSKVPMEMNFTLRLGKRIMGKVEWAFHPMSFIRPTVSYAFRRNDINFYEYGERSYNLTYNHQRIRLDPFNFAVRNFEFCIGAAWDHYFSNKMLTDGNPEHHIDTPDQKHLISYQARVNYNSENNWHFPTRGSKFSAKFGYYTDNFVNMNGETGTTEISALWRKTFAITDRLAIQPMIYGRLLHGKQTPLIISNVMGGEWFGQYLEQQLPFAGVGHVEFEYDKMIATQLQGQFALTSSSIFLLRVAIAQDADEYKNILKRRTMLGTTLSYYYDSLSGPVGATVGYSNVTKEPYFYVNLGYVF